MGVADALADAAPLPPRELAAAAPPVPAAPAAAPVLSDADVRVLESNRRMHEINGAPVDFPSFVRDGYHVRVLTEEGYNEQPDGLMYKVTD